MKPHNPAFAIVAGPSSHQQEAKNALVAGLESRGVPTLVYDRCAAVPDAVKQVACWGWHGGAGLRRAGHDVLVMERGYIGDRFSWTSLGWNGLNGRADAPTPVDGRRFWHHFGHQLRPWNPRGDYVLLIGQVPGDAALNGRSLLSWYEEAARNAHDVFGLPVRFRPHPQAIMRNFAENVRGAPRIDDPLTTALDRARAVITWNSNTAVEAILAGKPTIAVDAGSMAWAVASHQIVDDPKEPDRVTWASHLAWRQWTLDEIRSGLALEVVGVPRRDTPALRVSSNVR